VSQRLTLIAVMWAATIGLGAGSASGQAVDPTAPRAERFVVTGVVFVEGGRGLAWIQEPTFTNNKIVTVRPGDRVGPYRVAKILEDQVVLEGPSGAVSVPLAGAPAPRTAVAAVPAAKRSPGHEPQTAAVAGAPPVVVPRGDPRRNFPGADSYDYKPPKNWNANLKPQQSALGGQTQSSNAPGTSSGSGSVAAASTPSSTPSASSGSGGTGSVIIPPGDPRRSFPASSVLIGAR